SWSGTDYVKSRLSSLRRKLVREANCREAQNAQHFEGSVSSHQGRARLWLGRFLKKTAQVELARAGALHQLGQRIVVAEELGDTGDLDDRISELVAAILEQDRKPVHEDRTSARRR